MEEPMHKELLDELSTLRTGQDALRSAIQTLQQQNQILISLTESMVSLLAPKQDEAKGETLDQLLGRIIGQQTAMLDIAKTSSASLARLEDGLLPAASSTRSC
jgi:hypothetical protein